MPITILPKQGSFGGTLGAGIGQALEGLANNKISEMKRQKTQQGLQNLFEPQQAEAYSYLDASLLKPIVSEEAKARNQLKVSGEGIQTVAPELTLDQAEKIGRLSKGVQQEWYRGYRDNPKATIDALNRLSQAPNSKDITNLAKELRKIEAEPSVESPKNEMVSEKLKPKDEINQIRNLLAKDKPKTISELMQENGNLSRKEASDIVKADRTERNVAAKESEKLYNELLKGRTAANNNDKRLDRMEQLIDKGSLPIALNYKLLKDMQESDVHSEIPIFGRFIDLLLNTTMRNSGTLASYAQKALTATDTEEFEKLTEDFTRDAKDVYGSRVTNMELTQFLKMIPNLLQTDYGKKAVIRNMRNFNEATRIKTDIMEKIIKANGGKRPENLGLLIDELAKPQLDKLAEEYKLGIADMSKHIPAVELPFQRVLKNESITV